MYSLQSKDVIGSRTDHGRRGAVFIVHVMMNYYQQTEVIIATKLAGMEFLLDFISLKEMFYELTEDILNLNFSTAYAKCELVLPRMLKHELKQNY